MRTTARSFTVIANPIAGGGRALATWGPIGSAVTAAGCGVRVIATRDRAHATDAAREAADLGDVVVAVGGDGLVRDVVTGAVPAGGTIAVVPAGRGNDLVRALGLPPDAASLADVLLHGQVRHVDVLDVAGTIVPGNIYAGLDGVSTQVINDNRWITPKLLYRVAPFLATLRWRPVRMTVDTGAGPLEKRVHSVVVANSGWYGNGLNIVPSARPDDGRIDVLIVDAVSVLKLATFLPQARSGAHVHRSDVTVRTGTTVTLTADRPLELYADGDRIGDLPATVTVRPGGLRLLAPAASGAPTHTGA